MRLLTPEQRELEKKRAELVVLEEQLVERELELAELERILHAFEARYLRTVGGLYAELDDLRARIAEAEAVQHPERDGIHERATQARARATESAAAATAALEVPTKGCRSVPSDDLKRLFREIARQLHPDLATEEPTRERRTRLMAEANRAYAEGDEGKLNEILQEWQSSPDTVEGDSVASELVRAIRKLYQVDRRLSSIGEALSVAKRSDLHRLWSDAVAAESAGRDLLTEMAERLRRDITLTQIRLDEIIANGPRYA